MFSDIHLIRQDYGRFDRRLAIRPAEWPHFDLLWIHGGSVLLAVGAARSPLGLAAPAGVLVHPGTVFRGRAQTGQVLASITHFASPGADVAGPGWRVAPGPLCHVLQPMVDLSQRYARDGTTETRRVRLLRAILDGVTGDPPEPRRRGRAESVWRAAAERLAQIRTLSDVAALAGLSESAFRALHRRETGGAAGRHLQCLRLSEAERLLSTTGLTVAEIAAAVGYGHTESLIAAFRRRHGIPPGRYRGMADPFA